MTVPVFAPEPFANGLWRVDAGDLMASGFNISDCPLVIQDQTGQRYNLERVRPYGFDALYRPEHDAR